MYLAAFTYKYNIVLQVFANVLYQLFYLALFFMCQFCSKLQNLVLFALFSQTTFFYHIYNLFCISLCSLGTKIVFFFTLEEHCAFTKTLTIASRWGGQCLNKYQRCIFLHTRFSFVMYHDFSGFLVTFHIQIIIIYLIDINIKPVYYETKKEKILK